MILVEIATRSDLISVCWIFFFFPLDYDLWLCFDLDFVMSSSLDGNRIRRKEWGWISHGALLSPNSKQEKLTWTAPVKRTTVRFVIISFIRIVLLWQVFKNNAGERNLQRAFTMDRNCCLIRFDETWCWWQNCVCGIKQSWVDHNRSNFSPYVMAWG